MKTKPFSLQLSDEAELDLDKSYEFYYENNPKVADTFFQRIKLGFENIKENPVTFPIAHKDVRKYVIKKFPFVIYYRIINTSIQVIAIFHTSRNPEIWNERK
ncbi:type II toxin-antitoxin system RelE/ParE family toxin [Flavobacterium sp. CS20]|jgi:plasmid stabilization system protein ParE|uniref:type II toxin-antitoxin system RelE/ParE family toxin n=1 Tax=Flavobacterium sp. CS20 TaxID=2775246 RepID=UPI001B39DDD2|nr:type II toxin-antitoxin system RelE/ParE family toxin [Flavobacterium sp. CS20]QTY28244.1 type II toxin-antitoxin system RelE/ParE family toxin [Flavobacterium sp. CS20]